MILRFRFTNFKSFRDEQELSLIASGLQNRRTELIGLPNSKEHAVRVAGVYGANASGKSNVLHALRFMDLAVGRSFKNWEPGGEVPITPFGVGDDVPTEFALDFVLDEVHYQFGFCANRKLITEEWLNRYSSGRLQMLYSRTPEGTKFSRRLTGENHTISRLMRPNSLFLSTAAQYNHELLSRVYNWFREKLEYVFQKTLIECHETVALCSDRHARENIAALLRGADIGVVGIEHSFVPTTPAERKLAAAVGEIILGKSDVSVQDLSPPQERPRLKLVHALRGQEVPFELEHESSGTIAYLAILGPMLQMLHTGGTLVVDELDAGLHPNTVVNILKVFQSADTNPKGAQLLFNTHDATILSSGQLDRDQIWFTEKDKQGESHLYPLTDFKPRADENLERGYLLGRYGAIPYLSPKPFRGLVGER